MFVWGGFFTQSFMFSNLGNTTPKPDGSSLDLWATTVFFPLISVPFSHWNIHCSLQPEFYINLISPWLRPVLKMHQANHGVILGNSKFLGSLWWGCEASSPQRRHFRIPQILSQRNLLGVLCQTGLWIVFSSNLNNKISFLGLPNLKLTFLLFLFFNHALNWGTEDPSLLSIYTSLTFASPDPSNNPYALQTNECLI